MENDNFNFAFERYSEKHQNVTEDVVSVEPENLDQQYHRDEVTPKLREDFINYIENRFSSDDYFLCFNHTKSCSMIVYGDFTVGIEIRITTYSFPSRQNKSVLETSNLLREATFHISEPIEIIGLNKNSDINNPIRKQLNMLYSDMVNEQDCQFYGSRLSAMNGIDPLHHIDHKNGTLVINGIDKLDYFLGGISAITDPFVSNSKKTFEQLKFKRHILMWFKFSVLGFIVLNILSFLF